LPVSFLLGLTCDVVSSYVFGLKAIIFTITAYLCKVLLDNIWEHRMLNKFIIMFFVVVVYDTAIVLYSYIFVNRSIYFYNLVFSNFVTILISPLLFWCLTKIDELNVNIERQM
jgi:rod shape-determining protein MreD